MKKLNLVIKACKSCPYIRHFVAGNYYACKRQSDKGLERSVFQISDEVIADGKIKDNCLLKDAD